MKKDLTTSELDRQYILNNPYALSEIEKATGIQGIPFEETATEGQLLNLDMANKETNQTDKSNSLKTAA